MNGGPASGGGSVRPASAAAPSPGLTDLHGRRVESARRRVFIQGALVNSLLLYYGFFGIQHLLFAAREGSVGGMVFLVAIPVALALGFAWALSPSSFGRLVLERTDPVLKGQVEPSSRRWITTPSGIVTLALLLLTFLLGWQVTEMSFRALMSKSGLAGARNLFGELFTPHLGGDFVREVLAKMVETVFLAFMATVFAIPVAFVASFLTARNLMSFSGSARFVYAGLRILFNLARSIEPLIWAIIFSVWVGIGPFAGMLALMIHSVAALAKLYSEQIESVERGPIEAIEATGASRVQVVWYAVVPQIVLPYLSFTIYRWDINVRMATVVGLVGGGGLGELFALYSGQSMWHHVGTIVLVIAIVVWIMDTLSARIRAAIY